LGFFEFAQGAVDVLVGYVAMRGSVDCRGPEAKNVHCRINHGRASQPGQSDQRIKMLT
jgi:hypothetical protein